MSRIVVTGAAGHLGRRIVAAARAAGHEVTALVRGSGRAEWDGDEGVTVVVRDLVDADLSEVFEGARAVIHAAAGQGADAAHARDTLAATRAVVAATGQETRLVLVSSFSVYAVAGMPDGSTLDETSPVEADAMGRDAYARAKLGQERLAIAAAQTGGCDLWILRPGAIYGPGRTWTARLGWQKAGRAICPGGDALVPAINVDHAATALVAAATAQDRGWPDDLPVLRGQGRIRIVNLVDPDPPTQRDWLHAAGHTRVVTLPRRALMRAGGLLGLAGALWPGLGRRLPRALGEPVLAARFKPLRYSTARVEDRLGHRPETSFGQAMQASREGGT